jgi:hypothetical protein
LPEDVDLPDLGLVALLDLEHDVDAVLVELDDLRLDIGREAALAAIELDDPRDVRARLGPGEDLARRQPDLRRDLVVLDPLVAFKDDAVDDGVLANLDGDDPVVEADADVGEELGREEILQRLVAALGGVDLARTKLDVGNHRFRLEPLVAGNDDLPDRAGALRHRGGRGLGGRGRSLSLRRTGGAGLRGRGNRDSAQDRADQKRRAQPLAA